MASPRLDAGKKIKRKFDTDRPGASLVLEAPGQDRDTSARFRSKGLCRHTPARQVSQNRREIVRHQGMASPSNRCRWVVER